MKVLMVLAHPDDEIIFGWPIFQNFRIQKEIIMCSTDYNNPARQQYAHRKFLLQEVCEKYQVPLTCFDYPSEFYKLETRGTTLEDCQNTIVDCVKSKVNDFDYVFTVCDNAKEICPNYPKFKQMIHHSFIDPADATGTEQEQLEVYIEVRNQLSDYFKAFAENEFH